MIDDFDRSRQHIELFGGTNIATCPIRCPNWTQKPPLSMEDIKHGKRLRKYVVEGFVKMNGLNFSKENHSLKCTNDSVILNSIERISSAYKKASKRRKKHKL